VRSTLKRKSRSFGDDEVSAKTTSGQKKLPRSVRVKQRIEPLEDGVPRGCQYSCS
jgi:hypothetical protein